MMRLVTLAVSAAALISAPALADAPSKSVKDHHGSGHGSIQQADIVDTAIAAGSFDTLVAAVQAAGLVDTLKSDGPFTVFAPTDAAFAALPEGTVESLLLPENRDQLAAILTYHVVSGAVTSDQLAGQTLSVETVQGSTVAIDATNGVTVNQANVTQADIMTSNGVIHVIDAVIMPED
ncbi:fasciclin domain-containing protein [Maricaulis sp. CAU 1757]